VAPPEPRDRDVKPANVPAPVTVIGARGGVIGRPRSPRPPLERVRELRARVPRLEVADMAAELGCTVRALKEVIQLDKAGLADAAPVVRVIASEPPSPRARRDRELAAARRAAAGGLHPPAGPGSSPPRSSSSAAADRTTGTGTPCRVCQVDDGDDRVQPDLHRRCIERATSRAIELREKRSAARRRQVPAPEAAPVGRPLSHAELVARLAADRGGGGDLQADDQEHEERPAPPPRRRGRPPKSAPRPPADPADDGADVPELTADELDTVDDALGRMGLATGGLGGV
jgi:hypothetical protein